MLKSPRHQIFLLAATLIASACGGGDAAPGSPDANTPADTSTANDTSVTPADTDGPVICNSLKCVDGVASACTGGAFITCADHNGQCTTFESEAGAEGWCDCGSLAEGQELCTTSDQGVSCVDGLAQPFGCDAGSTCMVEDNLAYCVCDNASDGVCPDAACTDDPDCGSCTPSCGSRVCGDNGCGGGCGTCPPGTACENGECACVPNCEGRACGTDGCGGTCGNCTGDLTCDAGQCVADAPVDMLNGKILKGAAFTVSSTHLYVLGLGNDGRSHVYRCPAAGCTTTPTEVSSGSFNADYPDIEIAGDEVFWVQGKDQIWRADISGSTPGTATLAYDARGERIQGLRSDGDNAFALVVPVGREPQPLWIQIPGDGSPAEALTSTLAELSTPYASLAAFYVNPGVITAWVGGGNGNEARPIYSISASGKVPTAPVDGVAKDGLLRIGSRIVWVSSSSANPLMTCGVGLDCDAPTTLLGPVGRAIATDGSAVFFTQIADSTGHLRKCTSIDLLSGSCTPTTISSGFYWVAAKKLRVFNSYVYGLSQDGFRLVRAPL